MFWLFLFLSVFSDSFIQPVLAKNSWKMPNAQKVTEDDTWATVADFDLPPPTISVNLSTPYWQGKQFHYNIPGDASRGSEAEEFTIVIIDQDIQPGDPDLEFQESSNVPRDLMSPRDISALDKRANWVCQYMVACFDLAHYAASISAAQINAIAQTVVTKLSENNYDLLKRIIRGTISQFTIGIISGVVSWYITNKIQAQNTQAVDTCNNDQLMGLIRSLQADLRHCGSTIQGGDSRPRSYDHYAEDTQNKVEGQHLKHTVTPTKDPNDFKAINSC